MDLTDFINFKKEQGVKQISIDVYVDRIRWMVDAAERLNKPTDPMEWSDTDIKDIINTICNTMESKKGMFLTIRQYLRFKGKKVNARFLLNDSRPNVRWIADEDFVQCLHNCKDPVVKIILHLGGDYGLRRGEMAKLKVSDIRDGYMIVHGKGHGDEGKIRKVQLMDDDPILNEYLEYRDKEFPNADIEELIIHRYNNVISGYTPKLLGMKMYYYFKKNKIQASTHSLRREFITSAYRAGADIVTIMRIVGHEDPQTTTRYIECDEKQQKNAIILRNQYICERVIHS